MPTTVQRLSLRGFRNLAPLDLEPGPHFNVIHGDNGAGKSNVLEALFYLGALRSFRNARTDDLIQLGSDAAVLSARIAGGIVPRRYDVQLDRRKARALRLDGKRPRTIATWQASIQVVLFHPGHLSISTGAPEARRAFLDRVLEQMDPTYSSALASYTKALRSRNRLLKREGVDRRSVIAFDDILASAGAVIGSTRARLVDELSPLAVGAFREVIGESLPLQIRYRPRVEPDVDSLTRALRGSLDRDFDRGFTAEGPHGDDLLLQVRGDVAAKHHASQGQHRAIALALKIAELHVLTRRTGEVPVLLLDDVSSELDRTRNRRLFDLLGHLGGQVFLTTTHPEFILLSENRLDFRVETGRVTPGA